MVLTVLEYFPILLQAKDPHAKHKYSQITEAYKKLSSVMEGKDGFRTDDQHDVAAFMKIFMDMMGMTSESDLPQSKDYSIDKNYIILTCCLCYFKLQQ